MTDDTDFRNDVERRCLELGHPRMSWYEREGKVGTRTIRFIGRSCPCGAFLDLNRFEDIVAATPTPLTNWRT